MTKPNNWDELLEQFVEGNRLSMEAARQLAIHAIQNFFEHENLSLAQQFLEAMPANYHRREAFVKWLSDHAPVQYDRATGKLSKDKRETAQVWKLEVALLTHYWEYDPEPQSVMFGSNEVLKAMKAAVAKFTKTDKDGKSRYEPVGRAMQAVAHAQHMLVELEAAISADVKAAALALEAIPADPVAVEVPVEMQVSTTVVTDTDEVLVLTGEAIVAAMPEIEQAVVA